MSDGTKVHVVQDSADWAEIVQDLELAANEADPPEDRKIEDFYQRIEAALPDGYWLMVDANDFPVALEIWMTPEDAAELRDLLTAKHETWPEVYAAPQF